MTSRALSQRYRPTFWLSLLVGAGLACVPPAETVRPENLVIRRPGADALVVVFSRSGHTAQVGREVARRLGADLQRLLGPKGAGDSLLATPNRHNQITIQPARVSLVPYRLVVLGTPIWYWYPSAVIYQFVRNHNLTGKRVVLYYTFQGGLRDAALPEWKRLVEGRGGRVVGVFGIDRNRLEGKSLEAATAALVAQHSAAWLAERPGTERPGAPPRPPAAAPRPSPAAPPGAKPAASPGAPPATPPRPR